MILGNYNSVVVSISGGKDSQTILGVVLDLARLQGYAGAISAVHADTGAEWPQSLPHCRMLCEHYGIRLVVARPKRALPAHIERRCRLLQEQGKAGGWPSPACRYCTSDCKRDPISVAVRAEHSATVTSRVLVVSGERREESPHRAKLPELESHKRLTAGARSVDWWRPILDYRLADVWAHIAATGLPRHVAYDRGNERLSCAICVLASDNDIRNGAAECQDLAAHYLTIERETGHTFRHHRRLADILSPNMPSQQEE